MKAQTPWSIKGIDPAARDAAKVAAAEVGMTLGEFFNHLLLESDPVAIIRGEVRGISERTEDSGDPASVPAQPKAEAEADTGSEPDPAPASPAGIDAAPTYIAPSAVPDEQVQALSARLERMQDRTDTALHSIEDVLNRLDTRIDAVESQAAQPVEADDEAIQLRLDEIFARIDSLQSHAEDNLRELKDAVTGVSHRLEQVETATDASPAPAGDADLNEDLRAVVENIANRADNAHAIGEEALATTHAALQDLSERIKTAFNRSNDAVTTVGKAIEVMAQRLDTLESAASRMDHDGFARNDFSAPAEHGRLHRSGVPAPSSAPDLAGDALHDMEADEASPFNLDQETEISDGAPELQAQPQTETDIDLSAFDLPNPTTAAPHGSTEPTADTWRNDDDGLDDEWDDTGASVFETLSDDDAAEARTMALESGHAPEAPVDEDFDTDLEELSAARAETTGRSKSLADDIYDDLKDVWSQQHKHADHQPDESGEPGGEADPRSLGAQPEAMPTSPAAERHHSPTVSERLDTFAKAKVDLGTFELDDPDFESALASLDIPSIRRSAKGTSALTPPETAPESEPAAPEQTDLTPAAREPLPETTQQSRSVSDVFDDEDEDEDDADAHQFEPISPASEEDQAAFEARHRDDVATIGSAASARPREHAATPQQSHGTYESFGPVDEFDREEEEDVDPFVEAHMRRARPAEADLGTDLDAPTPPEQAPASVDEFLAQFAAAPASQEPAPAHRARAPHAPHAPHAPTQETDSAAYEDAYGEDFDEAYEDDDADGLAAEPAPSMARRNRFAAALRRAADGRAVESRSIARNEADAYDDADEYEYEDDESWDADDARIVRAAERKQSFLKYSLISAAVIVIVTVGGYVIDSSGVLQG